MKKTDPTTKKSVLTPLNNVKNSVPSSPMVAPIIVKATSSKQYIDAFDRTLERYIEYCGVDKHIERKPMILHQQRLWVAFKQGVVNTEVDDIDTYMDHIVSKFREHKLGVLGEQRLFRYLVNQATGHLVVDNYATDIYSLLQIACERNSENRPATMVDLNKAVATAETNVAEKIYNYFNKLGTPA